MKYVFVSAAEAFHIMYFRTLYILSDYENDNLLRGGSSSRHKKADIIFLLLLLIIIFNFDPKAC